VPFIATCTYCRASKFRVPYKKRGTFATCPKCEREFLLAPESGVDVPLMNYKELPFEDEDDVLDGEGSSELVETVPDHEPVPESNLTTTVEKVEVVVVSPPRPSAPDLPLRFVLISVAGFGLAVLATQFPYGRLVAAPLALGGLVLAALGWLGLEKYPWLGAAGTALNALLLAALLAFPSWLGLAGWTPEDDPQAVPRRALAISKESGAARPAEWVDAATAVWEYGDVRIAVSSAKVELADPAAKTIEKRKERVLRIVVKVENIGVARAIPLGSWNQPPDREVKLTAAGAPVAIRPAAADRTPVYPGKSHDVTLTFALPEKFDELRLELPGAAFDCDDSPRFQIPKAMIVGVR
jgi:hypothetical protein